jgi:hypothetical protein
MHVKSVMSLFYPTWVIACGVEHQRALQHQSIPGSKHQRMKAVREHALHSEYGSNVSMPRLANLRTRSWYILAQTELPAKGKPIIPTMSKRSQPIYARSTPFAVKVVSLALALTLEAKAASLHPYTGNTQMLDLPPSERATQFFPLDHIFQRDLASSPQ